MDVLWLNQSDVKNVLDMKSTIDVVEKAFEQHGLKRVQMPSKLYLYFNKYNGDLRTMPTYLEDMDISGVKIVNVHPDNPSRDLPTVMATVILNSTETGAPISIMDGTYLTDMRTGAGGGVAAKYLARPDSKIIGIIGTGNQARSQLLALSHIFNIEQVKITSKSSKHCDEFEKRMKPVVGGDFTKTDIKDVCDCDILVTTTPVRDPIVKFEWINEGTHINAIGADARGKQELESEILKSSKVIVDDTEQASHSGEINVPLSNNIISTTDIYGELGEIITGHLTGRESRKEITIFDSTGLAIQDISTADFVYRKAVENGLGNKLKMF
ncbi:alanine dehydrogenase [Methanohalobium evestigatum Z-7303]|uniref:Alanine dehydrogenase n=1 Tax=Methanohalobium evestigatum (strain ATCC BAA-1072 / DSM 3721 / NBRC 107634 / OCM 161 / Z-7303) TaxID=644295 RepID=D7E6K1_METEZ|nr:alanine dehydrogenase [Methanohalobium evestigatum]ADI73223.1 alanine dehydrogenase [Methanohalobium evestigatum Z-7303]